MTGPAPAQTTAAVRTAAPSAGGTRLLQRKCACGSSNLGVGNECSECQGTRLQRKLAIGSTSDPLEAEADRVAAQVMARPTLPAGVSHAPLRIQRFSQTGGGSGEVAPPSVERVLASPGRPLEPALRTDMEQRFGRDFSSVRVHTGAAADASARELTARAYTVGPDIVFASGRYLPNIRSGKQLLAHELTHVVQQRAKSSDRISICSSHSRSQILRRAPDPNRRSSAMAPYVRKVVVYWHQTGRAWAYLSNGSRVAIDVVSNKLDVGNHTKHYEKPRGAKDAQFVRFVQPDLVWWAPAALAGPEEVSVQVIATNRQRLADLPTHIRQWVILHEQDAAKQVELGEQLVRDGITADTLAIAGNPLYTAHWSDDPENTSDIVELMRRLGLSNFRSREKFGEDLARQRRAELAHLWTERDSVDYWREFPEFATNDWNQQVDRLYKEAKREEELKWRLAFRRWDAAASSWWQLLLGSAAIGTGAALGPLLLNVGGNVVLNVGGKVVAAHAGISTATWMKALGLTFLANRFVTSLEQRYDEAAPGTSLLRIFGIALHQTGGLTDISEAVFNRSALTGADLGHTVTERLTGGFLGVLDFVDLSGLLVHPSFGLPATSRRTTAASAEAPAGGTIAERTEPASSMHGRATTEEAVSLGALEDAPRLTLEPPVQPSASPQAGRLSPDSEQLTRVENTSAQATAATDTSRATSSAVDGNASRGEGAAVETPPQPTTSPEPVFDPWLEQQGYRPAPGERAMKRDEASQGIENQQRSNATGTTGETVALTRLEPTQTVTTRGTSSRSPETGTDQAQLVIDIAAAEQRYQRLTEKARQAENDYARSLRDHGQRYRPRRQRDAELLQAKGDLAKARDDAKAKLTRLRKELAASRPAQDGQPHGKEGLAQEPKYAEELNKELKPHGREVRLVHTGAPLIDVAMVGEPALYSVKTLEPSPGTNAALRAAERGQPHDLAVLIARNATKALIARGSYKWKQLRNQWNVTKRDRYADQQAFGYELPPNPDDVPFVVNVRVVVQKALSIENQLSVEKEVADWMKKHQRVPPKFSWTITYAAAATRRANDAARP